jgi:glyoxylase-like metal-dependent hydrolase (beta-lactamase superfamily II)
MPIKDGHVFNLGGRTVEAISIPGHTAGSICLLDDRSKILFTGDVINCGEIWMHLGESVSLPQYVQSLKKLAAYRARFEKICWGHSNAPITSAPSFLDDVIVKVEGIIEDKYRGELRYTAAGKGYYYSFDGFRIITHAP